ncbi:hypothetical protein BY458DRAFT_507145 [Sporodiniella umbellata]|nr:hypothetical protein BY458DRAFT_507145 [Sporodiniella umbellata]
MATTALPKKYFTKLPSLQVLSRPRPEKSEVTVYVKGFLSEGDEAENFQDWMHSHRLLVLSPSHRWAPAALGYSWPSGSHQLPIPLASATFLFIKSLQQLKNFRWPTPGTMAATLALDIGLHAGRLAYQFNTATSESHDRAEMLAWRLLDLRKKHDYLRVVGHSLGCRHIVEACSLMDPQERPDAVHLCAPALIASDLIPHIQNGKATGLGREKTTLYYSEKDLTLGVLLRVLLKGDQAVGEIGLPSQVGLDPHWLHPSVQALDVSSNLGGYYIGAHTDYANKFHYFAHSS